MLICAGCGDAQYERLNGETMGTYFQVTFNPAQCRPSQAAVEAVLQQLNLAMSTYQPDSEISRFNALSSTAPVAISDHFARVVEAALSVSERTSGAFDVTVGPLVEVWGFGAAQVDGAPDPETLAVLSSAVGYHLIEIHDGQLRKRQGEVRIDLSAIAKGYAVDQLAALLKRAGCADFLVDIGGEIKTRGINPRGRTWRLAIETPDPTSAGGRQAIVNVSNAAIATSGDYRNFRLVDGRRVHHIFDPRSQSPAATDVLSASVIAADAMLADAYATAMMVLGRTEGLRLAEQLGLAVYLISAAEDDGFVVDVSSAFKAYLE